LDTLYDKPSHVLFDVYQPPDVKFIKKESGGIGYQEAVKQTKGMDAEVARVICKEYRISCAEIILRADITVDQVRYRVSVSTIQSPQWLQALDELLLTFFRLAVDRCY
jgi:ribosome-interacting GTPase 1